MIRMVARNVQALSEFPTLVTSRFLSQSVVHFEKTKSPSSSPQSPENSSETTNAAQPWQNTSPSSSTLTAFDKKLLVWSGKYKSVEEVPETVARDTLNRARDRSRVKACLYMTVVALIGCIIQIVRGKSAAERGESVIQDNLDWHKKYNEDAAKKEAANAK